MTNCKACRKILIYSARRIGTGMCHVCGHRMLAKEVERLRQEADERAGWQCTPEAEYCTALEQLNRILAGLIRQYGTDGQLTLTRNHMNSVPLGASVRWWCTGQADPDIIIKEEAGFEPAAVPSDAEPEEAANAVANGSIAWEVIAREEVSGAGYRVELELLRRGNRWRVIASKSSTVTTTVFYDTEGRGTSPEAACAAVRNDMLALCEDGREIAQAATALRKLCYAAEDLPSEIVETSSAPLDSPRGP